MTYPYVLRRAEEVREALENLRGALRALLEEIRAHPVLHKRHAPIIYVLLGRLEVLNRLCDR